MRSSYIFAVMPALVAGIDAFLVAFSEKDVDGRDKPGHDSGAMFDGTGPCALLRPDLVMAPA